MMPIEYILGIVIGAVLLLIVIYVIATYNSFQSLKNMYQEAFSTMDVYLTKRYDLLTKLVEIAKGYATHEKDTLENVIKERGNFSNLSNNEKIDESLRIDKAMTNIKVVVEDYPELKANSNFQTLANAVSEVEEDLLKSRKYYNGVARTLNSKILSFPHSIIAKVFGFKCVKMYEADASKRNDVNMEI